MALPGVLAGGALLGSIAHWGWVAMGVGAVIGGLAASVGLILGQWLLSGLMSKPYVP
jgi:hypothetical protein